MFLTGCLKLAGTVRVSVLPKNTRHVTQPGVEPGPLDQDVQSANHKVIASLILEDLF